MRLTIILFWTDNLSCLNGGTTSLIKARLTARNQLLISSCQPSLSFFERKARAVRTDDSFYQMDSLSCSNRWHCFFKWITRSVWTDNNFFSNSSPELFEPGFDQIPNLCRNKPFTTISNFVSHKIHRICGCGAQCTKVRNGPLNVRFIYKLRFFLCPPEVKLSYQGPTGTTRRHPRKNNF